MLYMLVPLSVLLFSALTMAINTFSGIWGVAIMTAVWLVFSVLEYAVTLAWSQKKYPSIAHLNPAGDVREALCFASGGPWSFISTLVRKDYKWGMLWWPTKEVWERHARLKNSPQS